MQLDESLINSEVCTNCGRCCLFTKMPERQLNLGIPPSDWFKEMYPYFKKHLTKIGKNTGFTENETEKGNTWR